MKAMTAAAKNGGGDDYFYRLLSYLNKQFKEQIIRMEAIRDSVYLVKTVNNKYVVKGYSKYKKLRLQETFTATLRQEGFPKTYQFFPDLVKEPLYFEGQYFGCMEYLEPNHERFSFDSYQNRMEGLKLLEEFHQATASFASRYKTVIPQSNLPAKWEDRLYTFQKHASLIGYFVNKKVIDEMLDWAAWSLNGMKKNEHYFTKEPFVILHGDVAHHNFLRDRFGTLHLIDFDLISIGPASIDLLQYANRILPDLDWSLKALSEHRPFKKYLQERTFLYALAFPTDIFREWNRIIRERTYKRSHYHKYVIELTLGQYQLRKKFVKKLKGYLDQ